MSHIAVVTDSIACLPRDLAERNNIAIVPLNFFFEGKLYRDWVDVTPEEAYRLFLKDPQSFKAAPPYLNDFLEVYRQAGKNASTILMITVSSKVSSTYSIALKAREEIKSELPELPIEVIDSGQVATAQGLVALASARALAEGKKLDEVIRTAETVKTKVNFFVYLDTIKYVYRSGRVPKFASQAGSILNIKPVLTTHKGTLQIIGAVHSKKSGMEILLRKMREKTGQGRLHVAVTHAFAPQDAEQLKEQIAAEFDCDELWISEFSPLMGYACGTGTLGVGFYSES